MSGYLTPKSAPLCEHCGLPKTVNGQAQWICEPCRQAACAAGQKAARKTHCDVCGEPLTRRRDGRGMICVPCRSEYDRKQEAAIAQANGRELLERIADGAVTDEVRWVINPKRLQRGYLVAGEPLFVPA